MTYKIISKYIKDINFKIPNPKIFSTLSKDISNYKINIDIRSNQIKEKIVQVDTTLNLEPAADNIEKISTKIIYATIIELSDEIKDKKEIEKIILINVPSQIYPDLRKIFIFIFECSGFKDIKISNNVDFQKLYNWAEHLINHGNAYVDDLSANEIREYRGTLIEPGRASPYRNRSISDNLDLFRRMKAGEFSDGSRVLRAKIDMGSGNINLRDPVIYRIIKASHPRSGEEWCIYPNYDFAHGQSDALEGVTHSICTLEFEDHRPLYDWFLENLPVSSIPRQYEFSRLNLSYTVLSKRKLLRLVDEGHVQGWDDPRMPTLSGLRRRGFPPEVIRDFSKRIGVTKSDVTIEYSYLEHCAREFLNKNVERRMAVLKPIKLVIENYPEGEEEWFDAINNPEDSDLGTRKIRFTRELFIERDDFMIDPPKKFFRLGIGREVRLRYAYFIKCVDVVYDKNGGLKELRCTYDPQSRGGKSSENRKVKATLHWVSSYDAVDATVNLYNHLFTVPSPGSQNIDFIDELNKKSLEVLTGCKVEPALVDQKTNRTIQFERLGYFCTDSESSPENLVFNRTLPLKDTWARILAKKE